MRTIAKRDANRIPVALGLNYKNGLPSEWQIDPATGYLLMEFQPWDDYVTVPPVGNAKRDQNRTHVALLTVDGADTIQQMPMNKVTGLLQVDFIEI